MDFEAFLNTYGVAAAASVMLIKSVGVPVPIPGDVILLAMAARAAEGKVALWLAFAVLLVAIIGGGVLQYLLARGPGRSVVLRHGTRLRLTPERLERIGVRVRQGGPLAIGIGVLTPGLRSAIIPASGLIDMPIWPFVAGLAAGSGIDVALHFAIGYAGANILAMLVAPSPILLVAVLALVGLGAWLLLARRRRQSTSEAVNAWAQATCPVCLAVGNAVRWEGAA